MKKFTIGLEALQAIVVKHYGEEFYPVYDEYTRKWYVHKVAPYDTAACDWCSVGWCFCELCAKHSRFDPYEQCGEILTINGREA